MTREVLTERKLSLGERLERQRMDAAAMFRAGKRVHEVAAELGVAYATAHRWKRRLERDGIAGLRSRGRPGPDKQLDPEQLGELETLLVAGAQAAGYERGSWTLGRVRTLIAQRFGVRYSEVAVWKLLRELNLSPKMPGKRPCEADPQAIERWKDQRWPGLVAEAEKEQRVIVFVHESGLSPRSARKRTPAPGGQLSILEFNFSWNYPSAIGWVSFYELWFALHEGGTRDSQLIEFIERVRARIGKKLLLVWAELPAHGSQAVRAFLEGLGEAVRAEPLPACAPEFNPVEFLGAHFPRHGLIDMTPDALWKLSKAARDAWSKTQKRSSVIHAFWIQTEPPFT